MTTHVLPVTNVNQALAEALWLLRRVGVASPSRNGPVLVIPDPVVTEYSRPRERVLFSAHRDANPFFHLMESLWMLAGRNDVAWIGRYNQRFAAGTYSDDGDHMHGAYGFRWREWFNFDQIVHLVDHLRLDPRSRRAVLTMWSPNGDLVSSEGAGGMSSKDLPCNTHCYVDLRGDQLNLAVMCRSNDAVWGAYGANAVHFSYLQEYLAAWLRVPVGKLYQFSFNLHLYTEVFEPARVAGMQFAIDDRYEQRAVEPFGIVDAGETMEEWDRDLLLCLRDDVFAKQHRYYTAFFSNVVHPLQQAWNAYKAGDAKGALQAVELCAAKDWGTAAKEWLLRRSKQEAA